MDLLPTVCITSRARFRGGGSRPQEAIFNDKFDSLMNGILQVGFILKSYVTR